VSAVYMISEKATDVIIEDADKASKIEISRSAAS
jgi:hypothetical protein